MSRKNFGIQQWIYPMPVLIIAAYGENDRPNAMTAAWGMISDFDEISVSVSAHKTIDNIVSAKAFTVSLATAQTVAACDYIGIVSGNDIKNKLSKAGLHTVRSKFVNAPVIKELPLCFECRLRRLKGGILVGEIVNVNCETSCLTDGQVDFKKIKPLIFNPVESTYVQPGRKVADAFRAGETMKTKK